MNVEVTHKLNPTGTFTLKARIAESAETFMDAIFLRAIGELYISAYAVEKSLQGSYCSAKLFAEMIEMASSLGEVRVVRGIPRASNWQAMTDSDGKAMICKVGETPWAKAMRRIGYETTFEDGMITWRLTGKEST